MKPDGIKRVLKLNVPARLPMLLVGAPGVGKTDMCKQVAEELEHDLVITHPVVEDPTDAKGFAFPAEDRKSAEFLPFGQLKKLLTATKPTIWLMDDLGQASQATQAANMQWLLSRAVNGHRLPDCVSILAATNGRKHRAGVQGLLEPVKSRFVSILNVEVDLNQWCYWAFKNNIPAEIIAWVRFKKEYLCVEEYTAEMTNSPSPRTLHNLAKNYVQGHHPEDEAEVYGGAIGKTYADEFLTFIRLFRDVPNPDAILLAPGKAKIPTAPDLLWATATALVSRVNAANFGRFAEYADRLYQGGSGEFAAVMLRGALNVCPDIQHTPEFTKVASNQSYLMFANV